jgi:hypothetical protein
MMIELVLRILVTVDDKIQTAQSIIVARLLRNTENRLGERRKNRRAEDEKIYSRHRNRSVAIGACGQGEE